MTAPNVLDLIDYPDDTAKLVVARAVVELPNVTPLLVLADRFAEVGDQDREIYARRLAGGIAGPVGSVPGVGPCGVAALFDYLPPDVADVAVALAILTAPTKQIRPAARLSLLAALRLVKPMSSPQLDQFDPMPRRDARQPLDGPGRIHQASLGLLCRPTVDGNLGLWCARHLERAEHQLLGYTESSYTPAMWARWRIGWCCAVAADRAPRELMAAARQDADERRRELRDLYRRKTRYAGSC